MLRETGNNSSRLVTGIFWEPFGAASAITALLRRGFSNHDVQAVGVLEGHAPAISELLLATGLPSDVTTFYCDYFNEGAVLVMVRVDQAHKHKKGNIAIHLLKQHGAVYTCNQQISG